MALKNSLRYWYLNVITVQKLHYGECFWEALSQLALF
jgi:hypothetical protein